MSGFKSEDFYRRTYVRAERERLKSERYTKRALGFTPRISKVPDYAFSSFYTPRIPNYGIASFNVPKLSDYVSKPYPFGSLNRRDLMGLQTMPSLSWNSFGIGDALITSSAVTTALKGLNAQVPRISALMKNLGASEASLGVRQILRQTQLRHLQSYTAASYAPRIRFLPYTVPSQEDEREALTTIEPETDLEGGDGGENAEAIDGKDSDTTLREPLYPKKEPYANVNKAREPFASTFYEYVVEHREAIVVALIVAIVTETVSIVVAQIIIMNLL